MGLSGSKASSRPKVTDVDRSLLSLRTQRRKLDNARSRLHASLEEQTAIARRHLAAGQRSQALFTLRRKRLQEQQLERLDGWLLNVEEMLGNVEATVQQGNLVAALQRGNAALKQLQQEVSLDVVERLMEETADLAEQQARIQQLMGESWTGQDEAAAEEELEALEEAVQEEELAALPSVPTQRLPEAGERGEVAEGIPQLPAIPPHAAERVRQLAAPLAV